MNATNRRPASLVSREAVERLAAAEGVSVLAMLTTLQAAAAKLDDGEETLEALCALKMEIVLETEAA